MKTDHLRPHDILLCKGSSFISWLIRYGTKSLYSHVAVVADPEIYLAIESNMGHQAGVRGSDLRKLSDDKVDIFRVKPEFPFDGKKVISFLVSCLGADYDLSGVVWLGVLKFTGLMTGFNLKPYNAFQKEKDYFCSELVYQAFLAGGLDIVPQVGEADITSPGDIAESERLIKIGG